MAGIRIPFKRQFDHLKRLIYMTRPAQKEIIVSEKGDIDLVAIGFNNSVVIEWQIKLLQRFLTDSFAYTVVDNSPDPLKQQAIQGICQRYGVNYILPPLNPFHGVLGSGSHGAVLNWSWKNYINSRKLPLFGFLDHDIFPIKYTSLCRQFASADLFGKVDERGERWYLWSGFCFFRRDYTKDKKINFMPVPGLDTGGGNWSSLYADYPKDKITPLAISYENLRPGGNKQTDMVELIGAWLHTVNASEWVSAPHKNSLIKEYIQRVVEENRE